MASLETALETLFARGGISVPGGSHESFVLNGQMLVLRRDGEWFQFFQAVPSDKVLDLIAEIGDVGQVLQHVTGVPRH